MVVVVGILGGDGFWKGVRLTSHDQPVANRWLSLRWIFFLQQKLGGGYKDFLFSPLLGEVIQFDQFFSNGWPNHQLEYR